MKDLLFSVKKMFNSFFSLYVSLLILNQNLCVSAFLLPAAKPLPLRGLGWSRVSNAKGPAISRIAHLEKGEKNPFELTDQEKEFIENKVSKEFWDDEFALLQDLFVDTMENLDGGFTGKDLTFIDGSLRIDQRKIPLSSRRRKKKSERKHFAPPNNPFESKRNAPFLGIRISEDENPYEIDILNYNKDASLFNPDTYVEVDEYVDFKEKDEFKNTEMINRSKNQSRQKFLQKVMNDTEKEERHAVRLAELGGKVGRTIEEVRKVTGRVKHKV
eukprot:GDKK01068181.1.p1 GENE.GDKK01068181.1~~GDKK01068181.1.p1  ORF type:complete len:272 (-),score=43.64 GDKK01068181.1:22-837(-)